MCFYVEYYIVEFVKYCRAIWRHQDRETAAPIVTQSQKIELVGKDKEKSVKSKATPPPRPLAATLTLSPASEEPAKEGTGGGIFRELLLNLSREPSELRHVLRILQSFLATCSSSAPSPSRTPSQLDTLIVEGLSEERDSSRIKLLREVVPVVLANRDGIWTRMACPLLSVVFRHSFELGSRMKVPLQ